MKVELTIEEINLIIKALELMPITGNSQQLKVALVQLEQLQDKLRDAAAEDQKEE